MRLSIIVMRAGGRHNKYCALIRAKEYFMLSFSNSLKNLRKSRRMTQAELAAELGLSKSTISMYECGKREPELEVLKKLAAFFGVDMNELTG